MSGVRDGGAGGSVGDGDPAAEAAEETSSDRRMRGARGEFP